MAFAEDFTDFFDVDEFGVVATFDGNDVTGIFDNEYVEVEGIESKKPVFLCSTSDVTTYNRGAVVVINSVNYSLITKEQDGTGVTLCILEASS